MTGTHLLTVSQNNVVAVNRQPIVFLSPTRAPVQASLGGKNRIFCRRRGAEIPQPIHVEDVYSTSRDKGGRRRILGKGINRLK
jgi:hypothetical protein